MRSRAPFHLVRSQPDQAAPTGQCDCACGDDRRGAVAAQRAAAQRMAGASVLFCNPDLRYMPVGQQSDYAVGYVPSGHEIALLSAPLRDALRELRAPQPPDAVRAVLERHLGPDGDAVADELLELQFLTDGAPPAAPASEGPLIAWLHVTNSCNLRCHYCYLTKDQASMPDDLGRLAVDAVIRSAVAGGFGAIKLKYAGGEPTLRMPALLLLHEYAQQEAARHGLELDGVVLSNGVRLTPEVIGQLVRHGLRLMVSLDGLGAAHDAQRPRLGGGGSFDAAARGIERALAAGLVPDISVTVTDRSVDGLPALVEWLLERDLPFSLNFYRETTATHDVADLRLQEERIIAGMLRAFAVIERRLPARSLLSSLVDRANLASRHSHTCAVGHNYLVIDHHGRVAKCQMQIGQAVTTVAAPDPLAQVRADRSGVINLSVDEKEGCRTCDWRYWCTGGCPAETFRATGRYDVKSPNCAIYQALYPEVIRLEGLRLLSVSAAASPVPSA